MARQGGGREGDPGPHHDQRRPGEGQQGPKKVKPLQPLPRQEAGKKHDQQRPQIGDQPGLGDGRETQGAEIKKMITEQPRSAERKG